MKLQPGDHVAQKYNSIICTLIGGWLFVLGCHILTIEVNVTVTDKPITQHVGEVHTAKVKERK